ncbi:MAG TPA: hypothetical protein VGF97_12585 [Rhizomicrobium sp.]|jgi:hypothetical protein
MDRRYYILKSVILAAAAATAIAYGGFVSPHAPRHAMQDTQYQAAALMQTAIRETGVQITRTLGRLVSCADMASL